MKNTKQSRPASFENRSLIFDALKEMFRPKKARRAFRLGSLILASTLFVSGASAETIVIDADNAEKYPLAAKTTTTFEVKGESNSFTLSGLIAGEGVFAKAGPGTLTLVNAANKLSGGIQMIGPDAPSPYDTPGYGPPGTLILRQWSSADGTSTVQGVTSEIEILNGDLLLGNTGTGSLSIGNFGTVTVYENVFLGNAQGSSGTIGLSGKDATLTVGKTGDNNCTAQAKNNKIVKIRCKTLSFGNLRKSVFNF